MGNLVVCADGTWNTPEDKESNLPAPTNVVKLFNAIEEPGLAPQKKYYHPGVGTEGSKVDRLLGGGIGRGLNDNVKSGYHWLSVHYRPGDQIFLFGFSRGAYTVRSLGGMISTCGLLDVSGPHLPAADAWAQVDAAFDCYRDPAHDLSKLADFRFHNAPNAHNAPRSTTIHFIGVWDTVGALGIPDDLGLLDLVDDPQKHEFHNTGLSDIVTTARHAIAMDEMRHSFAPTLWTGFAGDRDVKQLWFPGVHGDVGGGYGRTGLSDGALKWMMDEAKTAGLEFRSGVEKHLDPQEFDVLHDSRTGVFSALKTEPRQVPCLRRGSPDFHDSAVNRHENPPLVSPTFWPTEILDRNETKSFEVFARDRWNVTRLFLEGGIEYDFAAEGEWLDGDVRADPAGAPDADFGVGRVVQVAASALGRIESMFKRVTGNRKADFWATKRVEHQPWFALIGVVANGADDSDPSHPYENQVFLIGRGCKFTPKKGGYFYCFANDAWHAYENNRGSISLTVSRTG